MYFTMVIIAGNLNVCLSQNFGVIRHEHFQECHPKSDSLSRYTAGKLYLLKNSTVMLLIISWVC